MADRKPPRVVTDERETLLAILQFTRESFLSKCEGLTTTQLLASPVASGTNLLGLLRHLVRAEQSWILERFLGGPVESSTPSQWDVAEATERYRATWAAVDAAVRAHDLDERAVAEAIDPPVSLRWILVHLVEETARHAGHADIIREIADGSVGR